MVSSGNGDDLDVKKELIVGRLCYLLKFRLTSLRDLDSHGMMIRYNAIGEVVDSTLVHTCT